MFGCELGTAEFAGFHSATLPGELTQHGEGIVITGGR
jgi:hypothetical protein